MFHSILDRKSFRLLPLPPWVWRGFQPTIPKKHPAKLDYTLEVMTYVMHMASQKGPRMTKQQCPGTTDLKVGFDMRAMHESRQWRPY